MAAAGATSGRCFGRRLHRLPGPTCDAAPRLLWRTQVALHQCRCSTRSSLLLLHHHHLLHSNHAREAALTCCNRRRRSHPCRAGIATRRSLAAIACRTRQGLLLLGESPQVGDDAAVWATPLSRSARTATALTATRAASATTMATAQTSVALMSTRRPLLHHCWHHGRCGCCRGRTAAGAGAACWSQTRLLGQTCRPTGCCWTKRTAVSMGLLRI